MRYLLQRINHGVSRDPLALMDNIARVTRPIQKALETIEHGAMDGRGGSRRVLTIVPARDGKPYVRDDAGYYWRCYRFIENAKTYDRIESTAKALKAAKAFGHFQQLLADMGGERLNEIIPDFHHTTKRYLTLLEHF